MSKGCAQRAENTSLQETRESERVFKAIIRLPQAVDKEQHLEFEMYDVAFCPLSFAPQASPLTSYPGDDVK